ncbi:DUF1129 family protein [Halalkalibacillus halophilus]|uniref:DUF1129 family protein n=1 Tax=Halalkalibacillus halophilus TaxID=392827 RepID=UPI00040877A0|nr:DUF1129 family protein [Halalkalibacillus halophilus]
MSTKALIEQNNQKREQLNDYNKKYYEDLLVYIRLQSTSERDTEEILDELLNHLLDAQAEGKTADDVFGNDPKGFADNLIGELPPMVTKERLQLLMLGVLNFAGYALIVSGILQPLLHWIFNFDSFYMTVSIGYATTISVLFLLVTAGFFFFVIWYIKWSLFKNFGKWKEFFSLWVAAMVMLMSFVAILFFTPSFGYTFTIPTYVLAIVGAIILIPTIFLFKKEK